MNQDQSKTDPVVSVVMPTYNGERFLRPAIESILDQTFRDFELIVIDDCSADSTPRILEEFQDERMVVLRNERNLGIAGATNRGLAAARGEYIALQDHDDISLPHRFQTQIDFLKAHPEVALIGSAATLIDENGTAYADFPQPCDEIELKWDLLWGCPIHHTAVMAKRAALVEIGGYSENPALRFAEAWDPLARIAMRYPIANLPESLVLWRRHDRATSISNREQSLVACQANVIENVWRLANAGSGNGRYPSSSDEAFRLRYERLRAFLFTPAGEIPEMLPANIASGGDFLRELQRTFYRINRFSRSAAADHSKRLNWMWGKHAAALAIRAPWNLRSRMRIGILGIRCLADASLAALLDAGFRMGARKVTPGRQFG
jgi:glycosyltransferase involved in cell wall biosynthesis